MPAPNAGIASSKSGQFTSRNELIIITPTSTSAGAVAAAGMQPAMGASTVHSRNITAVVTLVRPVRPPAPMPAALST